MMSYTIFVHSSAYNTGEYRYNIVLKTLYYRRVLVAPEPLTRTDGTCTQLVERLTHRARAVLV